MNDKYRNNYRTQSHRMPQWDYSHNGVYFITLVTQNRECNLGHINNGEILFSDFGKIVNDAWLQSFVIRNELYLDEYIVMPNHLHAIVVLHNTGVVGNVDELGGIGNINGLGVVGNVDGLGVDDDADGSRVVETHGRASLHSTGHPSEHSTGHPSEHSTDRASVHHHHSTTGHPSKQSNFVRKPKSISSFIAGFKSAINTKIDDYIDTMGLDIPKYNRHNHFFQPNYYDRIIRNEAEYQRIKNYIINNPIKWGDDTFNASNNKR